MRESTIEVGGAPIRLLEGGSGPTILWLHGIDGPRPDPLVLELAKSHRVIVPELPGFGRSSAPDWMMGVSDVAFFGLDLAEALKLDRAHLGGHSIGGWIAVEMAIRDPRAFASLTLAAPMGVQSNEPPQADIFVPPPDMVVRALFHDQSLAEAEITARATEDIDIVLQNRTGLARLGWTPRFANLQLPRWLHRVHIPTLVLWGEEDRVVPFDCHQAFTREIPHAQFIAFQHCGHALPNERGVEAARRISAFLPGARR